TPRRSHPCAQRTEARHRAPAPIRGSTGPMPRTSVVLPPATISSLDEYLGGGGGRGLERARTLGPAGIVDELARSGLRGRGGAGFPTATKLRSVREAAGRHRYAVANGAE